MSNFKASIISAVALMLQQHENLAARQIADKIDALDLAKKTMVQLITYVLEGTFSKPRNSAASTNFISTMQALRSTKPSDFVSAFMLNAAPLRISRATSSAG